MKEKEPGWFKYLIALDGISAIEWETLKNVVDISFKAMALEAAKTSYLKSPSEYHPLKLYDRLGVLSSATIGKEEGHEKDRGSTNHGGDNSRVLADQSR